MGGVRARVALERTLPGDSDCNWSIDSVDLALFSNSNTSL